MQETRHEVAGDDEQPGHGRAAREESNQDRGQGRGPDAGQDRDQGDHRDDGHVLEDQDAQGQLALGGVRFAPVGQDLEDHGRAAQRDQEPEEDRFLDGHPEKSQAQDRGGDGQHDLESAPQPEIPPDPLQAVQGEFEADHEQEHDHADLGQDSDGFGVLHQGQAAGADQDPGEKETHHRRKLDLVGDVDDQDGGAQEDDQLLDDGEIHRIP